MAPNRASKSLSRRDIIIDVAGDLFRQQGYNATSMRQIAEAAGYGKAVAGLYNHFENKEAIFIALLDRSAPYDEIFLALESIEGDTAEAFLHDMLSIVVPIIYRRLDFLRLVLIDMQEREGQTLARFLVTVIPKTLNLLQHLLTFPEIRDDLSPSLVVRTLVSVIVGCLFTEMMSHTTMMDNLPFSPIVGEAWLDGLVSILLHGLTTKAEIE